MKDRDGNEWVLVPVKATDAMVRAAMSAVNGALLYRWAQSVTDAIIAAAPQFVAGEVTQEMCQRVAASFYGADTFANGVEMREALQLWRSELGPTLGLETQRHRDNEIDALEQKLARADARIAEMERDNERIDAQWRDELRIYRETENARIAELEQAVTVRDTEIARLETDLELARRDAERYWWLRDKWYLNKREQRCLDECLSLNPWADPPPEDFDNAIDAARAGNGGGV